MPVVPIQYDAPSIAPDAYVAPSSLVMGKVTVGKAASIWYNAIVRGGCHLHSIYTDFSVPMSTCTAARLDQHAEYKI